MRYNPLGHASTAMKNQYFGDIRDLFKYDLLQSAVAWREAWRERQVDHAATRAETIRFVNFVRDQILA